MQTNEIYNAGYNCSDGTPNPYHQSSAEHVTWQQGYDDSIIANAQNLPNDHPDVMRLNCGYNRT